MFLLLPVLFLLLSGCKRSNMAQPAQTDSLNLTGETGRNLTIEVTGLRTTESEKGLHSICAIGLAGDERPTSKTIQSKLVCDSKTGNPAGLSVRLKNLPYPAYITVFHDKNHNRTLDFAVLNLLVIKESNPAEGIGVLDLENQTIQFSRPIWVEVGEQKSNAALRYKDMPLWKFVKDQSWQAFFNWYMETAHKVNHPNKEKNPFPEYTDDLEVGQSHERQPSTTSPGYPLDPRGGFSHSALCTQNGGHDM